MIAKNIDWITKEKRYDLPKSVKLPDDIISEEQAHEWLYSEFAIPIATLTLEDE